MRPALADHPHRPDGDRDWGGLQERMLVPLYEAAYERLDVGAGTRLLALGCGFGVALLLARARGALVLGVEEDGERLEAARRRLREDLEEREGAEAAAASGGGRAVGGGLRSPVRRGQRAVTGWGARVVRGGPYEPVLFGTGHRPPTLVTSFHAPPDASALARTATGLRRGTPVVLAGWGPAERCAAAPALRVAARAGGSRSTARVPGNWAPGGRDDLEELALRAGLLLDGSGRVACPFAYPDMESAVRGLLSTGLYDAAVRSAGVRQVVDELNGALRPHRLPDGGVRLPNLFRYVVARA